MADYYKNSSSKAGYRPDCIDCKKERSIKNRAARVEYYREYDRSRPSRVSQETRRKYAKKFPKKLSAHRAVYNAVKKGALEKQPCEVCGEDYVQAHHDDYAKKLEVTWLCPVHHLSLIHI